MKVVCVDNTNVSLSLSIGKWYEVFEGGDAPTETSSGSYIIISDRGNHTRISRRYFKNLEELRSDKLKELGI